MENKLRILLVDDDEDEYLLTQALLADRSYRASAGEQVRYELEWVGTFEEALAAFNRQEHDVYLVDYQLGGRDGLELMREVSSRGSTAPIIFMTGQGSYNIDLEAMRAGATDYLVKSELSAPLLERAIRYALERKRAEEKIRKTAARSELLARLSRSFAEAGLEYEAVVKTIARAVAESTGDLCVISLLSEDEAWIEHVVCYHADNQITDSARKIFATKKQPVEQSVSGYSLRTGKTLLIPDVSKVSDSKEYASDYPSMIDPKPIQSIFVVPLRAHGKATGTLNVTRLQPHQPYTQEDRVFFEDLAGRAELAIENARLYDNEMQRAREFDALHRATASLLNTLEIETLLTKILDSAQSAVPAADKGTLYLVAPDTGELEIRATASFHDPRIKKAIFTRSTDYTAQAVNKKIPIIVHDTLTDADAGTGASVRPAFRSAIIVPLLLAEKVHGAILLSASQPSAFTKRDLHLVESFAATTMAALHNARLHADVQRLAITDSLTDFYNRRGFNEIGGREVERAHRFGRPLSIIMVDIDNFKVINDTYGHSVGDQVLRMLAARVRASIRDVDVLGRYGGDEFIILLPETDALTAVSIAERIRLRIMTPLPLGEVRPGAKPVVMTASMGVASVTPETSNLSSVLELADTAAYTAKRNGRNRIQVA